MKLEGKTALVTGASRGIGRSIARAFAENGATVVVNYNEAVQAATETVSELHDEYRARAIKIQADVSHQKQVSEMIRVILAQFGRIDILVNNAGITRRGSLFEITEESWDRVLDVNLKGTFLCSQAVASVMLKQGGGTIVNISSMRGVAGSDSSMNYAVSKAGIIVLTKCLATELAPHIRVNCVAPGYVRTEIHSNKSRARVEEIEDTIPLQRFGEAEEVASTTLFLASDDASYITGETIIVSGGKVMD